MARSLTPWQRPNLVAAVLPYRRAPRQRRNPQFEIRTLPTPFDERAGGVDLQVSPTHLVPGAVAKRSVARLRNGARRSRRFSVQTTPVLAKIQRHPAMLSLKRRERRAPLFPAIRIWKTALFLAAAGFLFLLGVGCKTPPLTSPPPLTQPALTQPALPPVAGAFFSEKLAEMDVAVRQAVEDKKLPGGVLWLERNGSIYSRAYGSRAAVPIRESMTADTIFDAASLTKVLATAPAIMLLIERGKIQPDAPVHTYLPEFRAHGKESITIRHLLTHTSGLRPGLSASPAWSGYARGIQLACEEKPVNPPGTLFRYSDINFIVLGEIVRRVSGMSLDQFVAGEIYRPLRMIDTGFLPGTNQWLRVAPTERIGSGVLRGQVHDPTSRRMGGVAGHAGLFTTAPDLARFARMMLNGGALEGVRIFRPETVQLMTSVQSPDKVPARRGLGWDIDSPYSGPRGKNFPLGSYGHTGWTGTSIWVDPFSRTFLIFLSNRNHPTEEGSVMALRSKLGTLAAESIAGFNFAYVPGALAGRSATNAPTTPLADSRARPGDSSAPSGSRLKTVSVLNGIDVLVQQNFAPLKGLKIGLITNHSGIDRERNATIDLLAHAPGVSLKALFSPEHGIRGQADEKVSDSLDEKTGLPIYSLYGERRSPTPEQLRDLDALVFDIQDIGCRFYTYISTLGLGLEAAGRAKLKFFVLDRVNPINGAVLDGPVLTGETSFTAFHPLPVRHGLTIGELARMFNAERGWKADLTVIPLQGWTRDLWFDQTGLPWINPSPNMRSLTEAMLYPGVGLLETTALSVGRGTGTPFEVVGAPYIDDVKLAAELNRMGLAGVRFVPVRFTPTASVFKDQRCAGVSIVLTDRERCEVVDIGLAVALTLHRFYPAEFGLEKFNRLLGHRATIEAIQSGQSLGDVRKLWTAGLDEFKARRAPYLLYK